MKVIGYVSRYVGYSDIENRFPSINTLRQNLRDLMLREPRSNRLIVSQAADDREGFDFGAL